MSASSSPRFEPLYAQMDAIEARKTRLDVDGQVAFATGRLADAIRIWREEVEVDGGEAKWSLPNIAHCALWLGDLEGARAVLRDLDAAGLHASLTELQRRSIRAGIAAMEGDMDGALALYRQVLRGLDGSGRRLGGGARRDRYGVGPGPGTSRGASRGRCGTRGPGASRRTAVRGTT